MTRPVHDHVSDLCRRPAAQIALVVLLGLLAYSNTFHVPFVFDDFHVILENRKLDSLTAFLASDSFNGARWLPLATLALNRGLGGVDVFGFHVVNLTIHLATGLVIYMLANATFASFGEVHRRRYAFAPFVAALAFVLHPLHTQSVTYIVQRMTSLAALLYLAAILLYVKAVAKHPDQSNGRLGRLPYAAAVVLCLLAMSSKEISFTLPVVLLLYDICFLKGTPRERILRLAPFFVCLAVQFFHLVGIEKLLYVQAHGGGDAVSHPLPRATYLITELCVLVTYLRLLILPINQNLDYDYPTFSSLLEPQAAMSLALLSALVIAGAYLLKKSFRPECQTPLFYRVTGFAIAWFFVTISIESGLVSLIDTIFEHRVYLPSVWFFIAIGMGVCELQHRWPARTRMVIAVVVVLMTALGYATYRRNLVWGDNLTLWTDITNKSPGRARGWTNLGMYYVNRLDPVRAIPFLERAVTLNPDYYPVHYWLGRALVQIGDNDRALDHYLILTELAPDYPKGWEAAGRLLLEKNYVPEALNYLNRSVALDPEGFASHGHLQRAMSLVGTQADGQHKPGR